MGGRKAQFVVGGINKVLIYATLEYSVEKKGPDIKIGRIKTSYNIGNVIFDPVSFIIPAVPVYIGENTEMVTRT